MTLVASEVGHRLQQAHAEQWLYGANGDPYASVLRGFDEDPYRTYEQIRARGRLWQSRLGTWVTGDHRLAAELLTHPGLGVRPDGHAPAGAVVVDALFAGTASVSPERLRAFAGSLGTAAAGRLRPGVRWAFEAALDRTGPTFDLVADYAEPVPVRLLGALYGRPATDLGRLAAAAATALDSELCPQQLTRTRKMLAAVDGLAALFTRATDAQALARLTGAHDAQAARDLGLLLAVAGARTTADLIGNAVLALLREPVQWARLVADPDRAPLVVEETLRYDPPVQIATRTALVDLDLAGERVAEGSQIAILIGAANRDPDAFAEPDRFDPDRRLASGAAALTPGRYHDAVAPLARTVAETALWTLATRRPGLRTAGAELRRRRAPVTRSLLRCPVTTPVPGRTMAA